MLFKEESFCNVRLAVTIVRRVTHTRNLRKRILLCFGMKNIYGKSTSKSIPFPQATLEKVAAHLGARLDISKLSEIKNTGRESNEENEAWVDRYLNEM